MIDIIHRIGKHCRTLRRYLLK